MKQLLIRPLAQTDLNEIWFYIAVNNIAAADAFIDKITKILSTICENPKIGSSCSELEKGLRRFYVNPYVIFYTIQKKPDCR